MEPEGPVDRAEFFVLTLAHIQLLRHANVSWDDCEFGAPRIDPKRPFGNSDVVSDMAKLLAVQPIATDDGEVRWPPGTSTRMTNLHRELETALQVVLASGSFEPGEYWTPKYRRQWKRRLTMTDAEIYHEQETPPPPASSD